VDKVRDVTDDTDRLTDAELEAIACGGFEEWARLKDAQSAESRRSSTTRFT